MSTATTLPETGTFDLILHRGASYYQDFLVRVPGDTPEDPLTNFDLSGYTATAQIRSRGVLLMTFNVSIDTDVSKIVVEASTTTTAAIKIAPDAVWDLYLTDNAGSGFFLVQGSVEIDPQVTVNG